MENVILTTKFVLLALVILFTFSCAEDGAVGPQGPAGQNGTNGTDGQDGQDGNANVMSSDWFTPSSYALSTGFRGTNLLDHDQSVAEITQDIIDTGVVLVYGNLDGYVTSIWPLNQIALLPIVVTYGTSAAQIDTWTAMLSVGNIKIRFINNNNLYTSLAASHKFRYIIIPSSGSTSGRIANESIADILANTGVDINNYDEVAGYYGI